MTHKQLIEEKCEELFRSLHYAFDDHEELDEETAKNQIRLAFESLHTQAIAEERAKLKSEIEEKMGVIKYKLIKHYEVNQIDVITIPEDQLSTFNLARTVTFNEITELLAPPTEDKPKVI